MRPIGDTKHMISFVRVARLDSWRLNRPPTRNISQYIIHRSLIIPSQTINQKGISSNYSKSNEVQFTHHQTRLFSSSPRNRFLLKGLAYVKKVDEEQAKLVSEATTNDKIEQLLSHIKDNKELLYLLAVFHSECKSLGITQDSVRNTKAIKFYWRGLLKLKPMHDAFWDLCQLMEISNHKHRFQFNVQDLGLLDPKNFDVDVYNQLQSGIYNGVNFKGVETISFAKPHFKNI